MIVFSPDSIAARAELGFGESDMEITPDMYRAGLAAFEEWRAAPLGIGHGEVVNRVLSAALALAPQIAESWDEDLTPLMALGQAISAAGGIVPSISHDPGDWHAGYDGPTPLADQATVDQALPLLAQDGSTTVAPQAEDMNPNIV